MRRLNEEDKRYRAVITRAVRERDWRRRRYKIELGHKWAKI